MIGLVVAFVAGGAFGVAGFLWWNMPEGGLR
jgi:hypothetical protein